MKRVLVVFGSDREAIKVAPVVVALRDRPDCVVGVCVAAREEAMMTPLLAAFEIHPEFGLDGRCPATAAARPGSPWLSYLLGVFAAFAPDVLLVAGASPTGLVAMLAARQFGIPVAHMDAGVRSGDFGRPWSAEETNGRIMDAMASWFFVSSPQSRDNLVGEGVLAERIVITGNTEVDALAPLALRLQDDLSLRLRMSVSFPFLDARRPLVLAAFGDRQEDRRALQDFCHGLRTLARLHPEVQIVCPVPGDAPLRSDVDAILRDLARVHLVGGLDVLSLIYLMSRAHFVVSDNRELEDTACAMGKIILVGQGSAQPAETGCGTALRVACEADVLVAAMHRLLDELRDVRRRAPAEIPPPEPRASRILAGALLAAPLSAAATPQGVARQATPHA